MASELAGYELGEMLHASSRSIVHRARRARDGAPVVVKILRNEHPLPDEVTRFRQEYDLLCSVPAAGVIRAYGLEPYKNRFALATEDYGALSLASLLRSRPLGVEEALSIALQLAEAVGEVHRRGIIHKDINPNNIVVHPETLQAKLIDFGIATALARESLATHNPHVLEGTLLYISPEQTGRMNRAIDYRSDFYSLGITLYEMLTGRLPFRSDDPLELVHQHIAREPVPPHQLRPELPPGLSGIVLKLVAKMAEERYRSAYGLEKDLAECLAQWRALGRVQEFELARSDISDKFQVPQKLYGRQRELASLLTTFERVSGGKAELLLVAGYSGVGKSALVNEIQKPIIRSRGHFAAGKFDQLQRDVPYASLIQAFQGLVRQLLTQSEEHLASWRGRLREALGANGRVITEVIPEVELIIGAPGPLPPLPPAESQHRFNFVFQSFVSVMASREHPLVLFLDDLQWADAPSLKLLQVLLGDTSVQGLLIIGAYRDNEVTEAHPLRLTLEALAKAGAAVSTLEVRPLGLEHVRGLMADALSCEPERAHPLAQLVLEKTGGNPFFLSQFLKALHEEKLLAFEPAAGEWRWSLEAIRSRGFTDNIVDLMAGKLQRMPEETRHGLLLAACIGNQFDLETLATVAESDPVAAGSRLWPAIEEGLIVPLDPAYRLLHRTSEEWSLSGGLPNMAFRFLHDRVQQAAYSFIPEGDRSGIHLKVGRLLLSKTRPEELEARLFDVVNQLNVGLGLLSSQEERYEVARLNLLAGKKAKSSTAYEPARRYLTTGLSLLPASAWQERHALTFELYAEAMEAEFLCVDFERSWQLSETALAHATTLLERIKVYEIRLLFHTARNDGYKTVLTAFEALRLLGVPMLSPEAIGERQIGEAMQATAALLAGRDIADLADMPEMGIPNMRAALHLMPGAVSAVFNTAPQALPVLVSQMVGLSLRHGNAPGSVYGYALYAVLMGMMDNIEVAHDFDKLSMLLAHRFGDKAIEARARVAVYVFVRHRSTHLRELYDFGHETIRKCLEVGDAEYVGWASGCYCKDLFLAGEPLDAVERDSRRYVNLLARFKQELVTPYVRVTWQVALSLMGHTEDPRLLAGEGFDERTDLQALPSGSVLASCLFYIYRSMLRYLYGDPSGAVADTTQAEQFIAGVQSINALMWHHFVQCLSLLALYPGMEAQERQRALAVVERNQAKLEVWAKHAPMNYLHLLQLVQAERDRAEGRTLEAMEAYEQAIRTAAQHRYVQVEALAYERCAELYLSLGRARLAETYLVEARYNYVRWGATAKVAELDQRFPGLASRMDARGLSTGESVSITTSSGRSTLDLRSVLKAARAISSEIAVDKLLATLMRTLVENAGAERGVLLLLREERLVVQAQWTVGDAEVRVGGTEQPGEGERLSMGMVNFVARARQSVILSDATSEGLFIADAYVVAHRPKSVLAAPLINQDKLVAIVYLENNLTAGVFTADRLQVVELLLAQAALSIHNASLYRSLEDYSHTLERKVEQRTRELSVKNEELGTALHQLRTTQRQLVTQEKLASLGALTAGIAHELKNPLNFVNNFAEVAMDLADEVLEQLRPQGAPTEPSVQAEAASTLGTLRESVEKILQHGQRADSIIKGMLHHARTSRGEWEAVDFNTLVAESLRLAYVAIRAKFPGFDPVVQTKFDAAAGVVEVVRNDLNRVFLNMVENACYSMSQKSRGPGTGYTPLLLIQTKDVGGRVEVRIRDNGMGIAAEVATRLYEPFFTTKPPGEGTGLGLSISRDIVVGGHNGELTFDSRPSEFTEFVITLPRRASSAAQFQP